MDVIGNLPVWSKYTFPKSTTVANTRLFYAFMGSIVIGTCVDIAFSLLGSSELVLWPPTLVNIYALALMLILSIIGKPIFNCLYPCGWHMAESCIM